MPRTFSRGQEWLTQHLLRIVDDALTDFERQRFIESVQFRYCGTADEALEEQDIIELLLNLIDLFLGARSGINNLALSAGFNTELGRQGLTDTSTGVTLARDMVEKLQQGSV